MGILFSERAERELDSMEPSLRAMFLSHVEKVAAMPPRRHMRFGLPFNVENVTAQARMVYQPEGGELYVLHCFASHKDYERWYRSFK